MLAVILTFACLPAQPLRGERVACTVRSPEPFAVLRMEARAEGHLLVDDAEKHAEAAFTWAGPAAADTDVSLLVRTREREQRVNASFRVRARTWSPLRLAPAAAGTLAVRGAQCPAAEWR